MTDAKINLTNERAADIYQSLKRIEKQLAIASLGASDFEAYLMDYNLLVDEDKKNKIRCDNLHFLCKELRFLIDNAEPLLEDYEILKMKIEILNKIVDKELTSKDSNFTIITYNAVRRESHLELTKNFDFFLEQVYNLKCDVASQLEEILHLGKKGDNDSKL